MVMLNFKDWYIAKHGDYPGFKGERMDLVMSCLSEAFSDYIAEYLDVAIGARLPKFSGPSENIHSIPSNMVE